MPRRGPRVPDESKYCLTCGFLLVRKMFGDGTRIESKDKFDARKFCDRECFYLFKALTPIQCQWCEAEFLPVAGHINKYCSRNCWDQANNAKLLEPANTLSTARYRAKQLINHTGCVVCGIKFLVEIHHKDGDAFNNNDSNLVSVCRSCHIKLHRRNLLIAKCLLTGS